MCNISDPWKVVWITGGSSGIGRALAKRLASAGSVVAVSARSADKLGDLARSDPNIRAYPVDVTDEQAMARTCASIEAELGAIDLAVLNAGVWHPMTASTYDLAKSKASVGVNYLGVLNGLDPVMKAMIARGSGKIALIASVAGYRGLPKGAAYAPTKAALISLAESLRADLKLKGVDICIVNPGFVATPMTVPNKFPMPFIVDEQTAAAAIERGLRRGRFETVFPFRIAVLMKALRVLPYRVYFWLIEKIAKREPPPA